MQSARFSELAYPLIIEHADSLSAAVHTSSYVSVAEYNRLVLVLDVGDIQATGTVDCALYQATSTAGGSAKAISGKSITQLTQAGGDGDQLLCIELRTDELDVDGGFDCVAVVLTLGTATSEVSYVLYGLEPRHAPVPTTNWEEIVD